jgi:hypothetical protein
MAPGAGLLADKPVFHGDFKSSVAAFVEQQQHVYLPLLDINAWLVKLSDGSLLHVYEEKVTPEMFACDCCRIVGEAGGHEAVTRQPEQCRGFSRGTAPAGCLHPSARPAPLSDTIQSGRRAVGSPGGLPPLLPPPATGPARGDALTPPPSLASSAWRRMADAPRQREELALHRARRGE